MSSDVRTKPCRFASQGIAETTVSSRRLASLLTGGAVALTLALGTAMPTKAERRDDLAKAILGALMVGVLVNDLNDRPRSPYRVATPRPVKSDRVPPTCAITINGVQRSVTLYSETCLRREGIDRRLPRNCASSAQILGRDDRVYSAQCLRDAGFRFSGW